jgi:hypothetical protein
MLGHIDVEETEARIKVADFVSKILYISKCPLNGNLVCRFVELLVGHRTYTNFIKISVHKSFNYILLKKASYVFIWEH